ncbi:MAG TPA: DUF1800 domain-containing protein [Rhizomicrobium sp.]|jgi:uncharacterized protein (DUF1800 family)
MLDTQTALYLANRLGFGPAPGEIDRIRGLGFEACVEEQLNPKLNELPPGLSAQLKSIPSFGKDTFELFRDYWWRPHVRDAATGEKLAREKVQLLKRVTFQVGPQARMARMIRAIASPHRLQETLVDFWFNHFNVYERKQLDAVWIGAYEEEAIRSHTLGKFSDLLLATAKHPAMLVYLDNWRNVSPHAREGRRPPKANGVNENYAREVMELHTLGVDGGYTQADVTALAHILTGWTVDNDRAHAHRGGPNPWGDDGGPVWGGFAFRPGLHDDTPQTFLGRKFRNADYADGETALLMLAHHPSTAKHISFQLAQYFVADKPPQPLVDQMASTFRSTDGDLKAVMRTMLLSKEFRDPSNFGRKFKTPYQYVVSVARASSLDPRLAAPVAEELKILGQPIYGCLTPDGYACTESAWLDPDAMVRRLSFAAKFGSGAYMQPHLADLGYGTIKPKKILLQPQEGGTPIDADRLLAALGGEISSSTRSAVAKAAKAERAGLILGSPEFMRC